MSMRTLHELSMPTTPQVSRVNCQISTATFASTIAPEFMPIVNYFCYNTTNVNTLDLHLFMMSINSFLPIPVSRNASAALKLGMLS